MEPQAFVYDEARALKGNMFECEDRTFVGWAAAESGGSTVYAKGKAVTIKVSASGYANVGGLKDGAMLADFAPVFTVNKVKTVLAIKANLWFDRSNDHAEGAGEARFAK